MSAAEDVAPETARSLRGAEIHESVPPVELMPAAALPEWTQPLSTLVPLIRVAQWRQRIAAGDLDMGPGETTAHTAVLFAVAQYQGRNDASRAAQETIAAAAGASDKTGRTALAELVEHGWLTRRDVVGKHGRETHYAVATTPGRPIPIRPGSGNSYRTHPVIATGPMGQPLPDPSGNDNRTLPVAFTDKEIREEIKEKITEKTIAGAPASARACETRTMSSSQANLFGEPVCDPAPSPKPKAAKVAKAPKPPKPAPAPKAAKLYSAAYVAGMADAEPGCGFTPLTEAACGLIGMAAAAHAKDAATGEPITGEPLLAWIRKTAAEYRRAADPAFAKGFDAHSFLTWLNASRPKTRKVPLPPPPEPPRPPIVIPPPVPIPEMFQAMARADAAAGRVHPLVQHFENLRKSKET